MSAGETMAASQTVVAKALRDVLSKVQKAAEKSGRAKPVRRMLLNACKLLCSLQVKRSADSCSNLTVLCWPRLCGTSLRHNAAPLRDLVSCGKPIYI